jgi:uncharacterized coiled-coil protein SlyX
MQERLLLFAGVAAACLVVGPAWNARAAGADTGTAGIAKQNQPAKSNVNWRYTYRDGRWWYWLPSNSWAYHNGRSWVRYEGATSLARDGANRTSTIRYSSYAAPVADPERYLVGQPPSAPASLEEMQQQLAQTQQRLQQLEARVGAQQQAMRGISPMLPAQSAQLRELWRARQADVRFYDYGSDYYFTHGKGHFTD